MKACGIPFVNIVEQKQQKKERSIPKHKMKKLNKKRGIKMTNSIKLDIHGIQCDHCDYNDPTVKVEEYLKWLNKPCPNCGENLLTQADYNNVQMLIQFTKMKNDAMTPRKENEIKVGMKVKMNGTGKMDLIINNEK